MPKMQIEYIPVDCIQPYERNAKKHPPEQVEQIANSIREFGFKQPLVVDAKNVLVIGHGRLMAAKLLEMVEVPCVRADDLTPEQIKALRLADNKLNESAWDFDLLDTELAELDGLFDMTDFGFDSIDSEQMPEIKEEELKPFRKVFYLVYVDINEHDKIIPMIDELRKAGANVESSLN